MLGKHVGDLLGKLEWCGVPFAGGMSELPHIKARTIIVGDKHRHILNLARCAKCEPLCEKIIKKLDQTAFHPDELAEAQERCRNIEGKDDFMSESVKRGLEDPQWAVDFFVSSWMARNGVAATEGEFDAGLSIRWNASGGDSVVRFRNATEALKEWNVLMRKCTFVDEDCFGFIAKCKDEEGHGIYCDPPWPDDGDKYKCAFSTDDQRQLADMLSTFDNARVVVRFGDHPLIRELYPESHWEWKFLDGRTAANKTKKEVLLVNRRSS